MELPARFETTRPEETERVAGAVASLVADGGVVALEGDLGAGKTTFTRGLAAGLGADPRQVSSPTFAIMVAYDLAGGRKLWHLDAYRVAGEDDFVAIGFEDLPDPRDVVVVEWPQRVAALLPATTLRVSLVATSEGGRTITVDRIRSAASDGPGGLS